MDYLMILVGLLLLLLGANYLVDASVAIAKRLHISDFVIGLTIVGFGTSAPELFVSVSSALRGMGDVAIGNVIGSNICNSLLILGVTAIVCPVLVRGRSLRVDVMTAIALSVLVCAICYFNVVVSGGPMQINRVAGLLLLAILGVYLFKSVKSGRSAEAEEPAPMGRLAKLPIVVLALMAVASLAVLLYGGDMFVDSSVSIARKLGMSDFVISTTIIAVGTSLPELITCVIAAFKKNTQLALGNVVGSNIFNILFILGASATVYPLTVVGVCWVDFAVFIGSMCMVAVSARTFKAQYVDRKEGVIMFALYVVYVAYLVMR